MDLGIRSHDISLDAVPISFIAPHADQVASVVVRVNNQVKANIDPNSSLLKTAVLGIPDRGYLGNPSDSRAALLSSVSEIERLLSIQSYHSVDALIATTVVPQVIALVTEGIVKQDAREFTREEVIAAINSVKSRMSSLNAIVQFPKNGIIELSTDKSDYVSGERAQVKIRALTLPKNPELEFHVQLTLDGQLQKIEAVSNKIWIAATSRLNVGLRKLVGKVFLQPTRQAKGMESGIESFEKANFDLERKIKSETDPEKIQEIRKQIAINQARISDLENQLNSIRRQVGKDVELDFATN